MQDRPLKDIYMSTASGKKYFPFAPQAAHVDVNVIAHHLACHGRWAGATRHPKFYERIYYSVAEHAVYVSEYLENEMGRPDLAFEGLHHDDAEAYNGDLIRPLKYSPDFREPFKKVELLNEAIIAEALGLPVEMSSEVKIADNAVCAAEQEQIVPRDPNETWDWDLISSQVVAPVQIHMFMPYAAKKMFLERHQNLIKRGLAPQKMLDLYAALNAA